MSKQNKRTRSLLWHTSAPATWREKRHFQSCHCTENACFKICFDLFDFWVLCSINLSGRHRFFFNLSPSLWLALALVCLWGCLRKKDVPLDFVWGAAMIRDQCPHTFSLRTPSSRIWSGSAPSHQLWCTHICTPRRGKESMQKTTVGREKLWGTSHQLRCYFAYFWN